MVVHNADDMMARDLKVVAVAGACFPCMPHMPRAQRNSRELAGSVQTACNGGRCIYRRAMGLGNAVGLLEAILFLFVPRLGGEATSARRLS